MEINNSLLKDKDYTKILKYTIARILSDNPFNNKNMLWEFTKCNIRTETIIYAGHKAKCKNMRKNEILLSKLKENFNLTNDKTMLTEYEKKGTIQTEKKTMVQY